MTRRFTALITWKGKGPRSEYPGSHLELSQNINIWLKYKVIKVLVSECSLLSSASRYPSSCQFVEVRIKIYFLTIGDSGWVSSVCLLFPDERSPLMPQVTIQVIEKAMYAMTRRICAAWLMVVVPVIEINKCVSWSIFNVNKIHIQCMIYRPKRDVGLQLRR